MIVEDEKIMKSPMFSHLPGYIQMSCKKEMEGNLSEDVKKYEITKKLADILGDIFRYQKEVFDCLEFMMGELETGIEFVYDNEKRTFINL